MSSPEMLSIGVVARLTGRQPSAIRYYEEIGLLPAPLRVSGRRMYEPEVVRTLAVIETAQSAGLTLDEIRTLLETKAQDGESIERLRAIARRKLPEVTALIRRTELVREWLACAERCECPSLDDCPLFDEAPRRTFAARTSVPSWSISIVSARTRPAARPASTSTTPVQPSLRGRSSRL